VTGRASPRRSNGWESPTSRSGRWANSEADLLALDEPTVGVDADSREEFYGLLDELNRAGITIILIEHDVDILTEHVDTVACLNQTLYHHGDTVSFLESDAIAEAYGSASQVLAHDHP